MLIIIQTLNEIIMKKRLRKKMLKKRMRLFITPEICKHEGLVNYMYMYFEHFSYKYGFGSEFYKWKI